MTKNKLKKKAKAKTSSKGATGTQFYKHKKFGHVYGKPVKTGVGRLSWGHLVNPREYDGEDADENSKPRYEFDLIMDPSDKGTKGFIKAVEAQLAPADNEMGMLALFNKGRSVKIGDVETVRDEEKVNLEKNPQYEDSVFIQGRRYDPIPVVDESGKPLDASKLENGMLIRAVLEPMLTAHGISYKCALIQFVEDDGERYAGGQPSINSYLGLLGIEAEDVEEEEEDDEEFSDDEEEEEDDDVEVEVDEDEEEEDEEEDEEEEEDDLPEDFVNLPAKKEAKTKTKKKAKAKTIVKSKNPKKKKAATSSVADDKLSKLQSL